MKENAELVKYQNLENRVKKVFDLYKDTAALGRATGVGASEELENEVKNILINDLGYPAREVKDSLGAVLPGLKPGDVEEKRNSFLRMIESKKPPTPLLDSIGVGSGSMQNTYQPKSKREF
jgi:hypothetical protein